MMNKKDGNKEQEEFKYLIDSRITSDKEKEIERNAVLKAREKRLKNSSESEKIVAQLLQLKYQMEDHLNKPVQNVAHSFSKFLGVYIDTLYRKRKDFASDIDVNPIELSQIINNHRQPKEEFLIRLNLHSQAVFENFSHFKKDLWPKLYYFDKVGEFLITSEKRKKSEEKHVKSKVVDI